MEPYLRPTGWGDIATFTFFSLSGLFLGGETGFLFGSASAAKSVTRDPASRARIEDAFRKFRVDVLKEEIKDLEGPEEIVTRGRDSRAMLMVSPETCGNRGSSTRRGPTILQFDDTCGTKTGHLALPIKAYRGVHSLITGQTMPGREPSCRCMKQRPAKLAINRRVSYVEVSAGACEGNGGSCQDESRFLLLRNYHHPRVSGQRRAKASLAKSQARRVFKPAARQRIIL